MKETNERKNKEVYTKRIMNIFVKEDQINNVDPTKKKKYQTFFYNK